MAMKFLPGSLTPAFFTRLQKYFCRASGPAQAPSQAQTNSVRFRSSWARTASSQAGLSVSVTKRRGNLGFWKAPRRASAASAGPPAPSSTTEVKPSSTISEANFTISFAFGSSLNGASGQARAAAACFFSPAPLQRVVSFFQKRAGKFSAASAWKACSAPAGAQSGAAGLRAACRSRSMRASSPSCERANFSMPSFSRSRSMAGKSIPSFLSSAKWASAAA